MRRDQKQCSDMVPTSFGTMMKSAAPALFVTLLLIGQTEGTPHSPPGKPRLTSCRSPEKETFTCWWEPGSDGGLPTTYALYYRKENSDMVHECPDYQTAGENSCFFNKNNTSIWINYNITVVATNRLGSNLSEPVEVDVVYIVQPHTPENVTVTLIEDKDGPFFKVSWEPPPKADTRSGWITLIYELRVKLEGDEEWEEHRAGQQRTFNIFSLRSGGTYLLQVRCKPDHGFWSEWSSTTYISVPDYIPYERSMSVVITVLSAVIFLILTCILNIKIHSVKHFLLPPVPRPKINGFDKQLLKDGRYGEVCHALVVPGLPLTTMSECEDLLVKDLEVNALEEQALMLEECKDLQEDYTKSQGSPSDIDSGRGSCESHILLMDRCGEVEAKEYERKMEVDRIGQRSRSEEGEISQVVSPDVCDGRVKTWPCVFSPLPQYSSRSLVHLSSLETTKPLCLSDSLFAPPAASSQHAVQHRYGSEDGLNLQASGPDGFRLDEKRPEQLRVSQTQPHVVHLREAHGQYDIPRLGRKDSTGKPQQAPFRFEEYVEVHEVSKDNMVLLQPLSSDQGQRDAPSQLPEAEDYSKVKGMDSGNVLLLQREAEARGRESEECPCDHEEARGHESEECPCEHEDARGPESKACPRDHEETDRTMQSCCTMSATLTTQTLWTKPNVSTRIHTMPLQGEMVLAENGYVDTTAILMNH